MHTVDIELFQHSVAFTVTMKRWGNRRKARIQDINITSKNEGTKAPDKELLKLSKVLIQADEYDAIVSHQGETRRRVEAMSVPSFFKKGILLIGTQAVPKVEEYLNRRVEEQKALVMTLAGVYPQKIVEAEQRLGSDLFDSREYPMVNELTSYFDMSWNWIAFGVPDNLPAELRAQEKAKAEAVWKDATDQITLCLRGGFKELVDNMVERLMSSPGEDKKVFRDSLVGNMVDFLDMFNSRNIVNDSDLNQLVGRARDLMKNVSPKDIRDNDELRGHIASQFAEMQASLGSMIEEMPTRTFNFEE